MTAVRCPAGHESTSVDYCDVCGAPIDPSAAAAPPPASDPVVGEQAPPSPLQPPSAAPANADTAPGSAPAATKACENCGAANAPDALFCEDCGYDFTTGQRPSTQPLAEPPAPTATIEWVAEMWVDPDWYTRNRDEATEPCPPAGTPKVVPLPGASALVGRPSASRQIHPQVDCTPDTGVSRRHAQLLFDRDRWFVEDLGSTNGTFVAGAGVLPSDPIPSGQRRELGDNDRVYVGAWTRIVVRRAMPHEATDQKGAT
jgi:hypothetical protein